MHRSQFELERVLDRYGATDFALAETDASAAIQFAIDGCHVELALPLPDPHAPHVTHTSSGRPRTIAAQERAYEQALREHWRGLLLAVRGKLQSVESGLSTFEDEFRNFLAPHLDEKTKRERKKPRAVNWLLGSSHSLAIALVAAFLVPASAVGAFALPPTVVGHLAAPFRGTLPTALGVPSDDARAVALGRSIWARDETSPAHRARPSRSAHRGSAATVPQADHPAVGSERPAADLGGLRSGGETPPSPPSSSPQPPPPSSPPAAPSPAEEPAPAPEAPAPAEEPPASPPQDESDTSAPAADEPSAPSSDESESTGSPAGDAPDADPAAPPPSDNGKDKGDGHDNGNHNGADNGNGNGKAKGD